MLWVRNGIREVSRFRSLRYLLDGCLAKGERTSLFGFTAHQLNDAEQLVPDAWMGAAQQARELLQAPLPPHPAVQGERHDRTSCQGRHKNAEAYSWRCVPDPVEEERQQIRGQDAKRGP